MSGSSSCAGLGHPAIHFVCTDLVIAFQSELFCRFEQNKRAKYIRPQKRVGVENRTVYMRLGGKIHNGINVVIADGVLHIVRAANVALHKRILRVVFDIAQVVQIPRVGEFIKHHNLDSRGYLSNI